MCFSRQGAEDLPRLRISAMAKGTWREFDDSEAISKFDLPSFSSSPKNQRRVRVQRTRGGKRGKTVTLISGLELGKAEASVLLKCLKARCGTGGTLKGDFLELQGDQVMLAIEILKKEGYRPKQSGG